MRSTRFRGSGGGGGGGSTVHWGPDFGGDNGDQFAVETSISLDSVTATYDPLGVLAAISLTQMSASFAAAEAKAGIVELIYAGDYTAGGDSAANDGPDNWTNPNNATGKRNGGEASRAGQALASTDANLRLGYANFAGGMETLTISLVQLRYDTRQTGTALANGGLHHEYRLVGGGAWTSLEVFTGDVDNDPKIYDITTAVGGSWTNLDALEVRVRAVLGLGTNLVSCFCDAVEVRIVASKTVVP